MHTTHTGQDKVVRCTVPPRATCLSGPVTSSPHSPAGLLKQPGQTRANILIVTPFARVSEVAGRRLPLLCFRELAGHRAVLSCLICESPGVRPQTSSLPSSLPLSGVVCLRPCWIFPSSEIPRPGRNIPLSLGGTHGKGTLLRTILYFAALLYFT